jgi:hypothetical protein
MNRTSALRLSLVLLAASPFVIGGCYERTVSAKGFGADRAMLAEPNSPEPVKTTKVRQHSTHKQLPPQRMRIQEQ